MPGCNACTLGIEHQLAHTDGNTSRSLIADTKNTLVVRYNRHPNVSLLKTAEYVFSVVYIAGKKMESVGRAKHGRVVLTGKSYRGGIDNGHVAADITLDQGMCQGYVSVKQGTDINKTLYIGIFIFNLKPAVVHLFFQATHGRRQHGGHTEP